tara:strand:+ start:1627 stop:2454 length:828 start_codon:yes stop_codon:yes gene_type:complete
MALSDFFEAQRTYKPSPASVRREAKWVESASKYKSTRGKVKDGQLIKVDPKLAERTAKAIAKTCPIIAEPFNRHMGPLALRAFNQWPVETGLSKSLLSLEYKVDSGEIRGVLKDAAPYAYFIRQKTGAAKSKGKKRTGSGGRSRDVGKKDTNRSRWLTIAEAPARKRDPTIWAAATLKAARSMTPVTYAAVQNIYERIKSKRNHVDAWFQGYLMVKKGMDPKEVEMLILKVTSPRRPRKKKGKNIAKDLVFDPGKTVAEQILRDIQTNIAREFKL